MEANPNKFQVIYSHDSDSDSYTININGSLIKGLGGYARLLLKYTNLLSKFLLPISAICSKLKIPITIYVIPLF